MSGFRMSDRRIPREGALRVRLLAGAAMIACMPALPALAQVAPAPAQTATPPASDGLTPGSLYVTPMRPSARATW